MLEGFPTIVQDGLTLALQGPGLIPILDRMVDLTSQ